MTNLVNVFGDTRFSTTVVAQGSFGMNVLDVSNMFLFIQID